MNATTAFADLHVRYSGRLTAHVGNLLALASRRLDDRHDIAQEVWLRAVQQDSLPDWAWLEAEVARVIEEMAGLQEEVVGLRPTGDLADFDFTEPILDSLSPQPAARTPEEFRAQHGDCAGWDTADFEAFENLARTQVPEAEVVEFLRTPPVGTADLPLAA
ncbi:hypothetical protein [Streptomyces ramulosus]|uniref:hypothetical protein n=1 Tax=Streptomyces TaxID=1883 RepID=UPI0031E96A55